MLGNPAVCFKFSRNGEDTRSWARSCPFHVSWETAGVGVAWSSAAGVRIRAPIRRNIPASARNFSKNEASIRASDPRAQTIDVSAAWRGSRFAVFYDRAQILDNNFVINPRLIAPLNISEFVSVPGDAIHPIVDCCSSRASLSSMQPNGFPALSLGCALVTLMSGFADATQDSQVSLMSNFVCEHPPYKVHLVSHSPLVIYIADFLTERERDHLQRET